VKFRICSPCILEMPLDCTIDSAALLKILLHAAKYPASPINGLLLGRGPQPESGSNTGSDTSGGSLQIIDAVPLFHSFLHLSMPLESALVQASAERWCTCEGNITLKAADVALCMLDEHMYSRCVYFQCAGECLGRQSQPAGGWRVSC
jgi:Uncharacterised protein family (UPF0172)